jgi:hypothetical protein
VASTAQTLVLLRLFRLSGAQPLAHEKESSSYSQRTLSLLGLLCTAASLGVFAWLWSRSRTPYEQAHNSVTPHYTTDNENKLVNDSVLTDMPPAPPNHNDSNGSADNTPPWKKVIEVLAVITGIALLGVNILLWRSSKEALKLTREQVHTGQRAYLIFHAATLEKPPAINESPHATLTLTNSGETPAVDVLGRSVLMILDADPINVDYGLLPISPLAKGQDMKLNAILFPPLTAEEFVAITVDDIDAISKGLVPTKHPRLYLFGTAHYKDVFNGLGEAEFCAVYIASQKIFASCPTHNTMK